MKKINQPRSSETGKVFTIVLVLLLIIILGGVFWVKQNIYANPFNPTLLTPLEKQVLDTKIKKLNNATKKPERNIKTISFTEESLKPEAYSEDNAKREILISERELNSLIKDPEIAKRVAVDLSDDLLSVKLLVPMDDEFPILGGTTLKLHFGTILAYTNDTLFVAMKGVSIGGIPLPSAWWGGIKNENLVEYFGGNEGFWDTLAKGIDDIKISEQKLYVKLKE